MYVCERVCIAVRRYNILNWIFHCIVLVYVIYEEAFHYV